MEILLISLLAYHFHMSKISLWLSNILETSIHLLQLESSMFFIIKRIFFYSFLLKFFSPHSDPFLTLLGVTAQKHYRKANFKVLMILQNYYWDTMTFRAYTCKGELKRKVIYLGQPNHEKCLPELISFNHNRLVNIMESQTTRSRDCLVTGDKWS